MFTLTTTTLPSTNLASLAGITYILILILDIASVVILCIGVGKALLAFFAWGLRAITTDHKFDDMFENNRIKQQLGSFILLSLEILIAADIIKSILEPSLEDLLILGAIVIIRTIMSYFLEKETADSMPQRRKT